MVALALAWATVGVAAQAPSRRARAERLHQRGTALAAAGHVPGALGAFRAAIGADPSFGPGYVGLAQAYLERGDLGAALEVVEVGRRRLAADLGLGLVEVRIFLAQERADDARDALRALCAAHPRAPTAWVTRARVAREAGRFAEALAAYRVIVRLTEEGVVGDRAIAAEAPQMVAALRVLARELDVTQRGCDDSEVRAALCQ